ncbi:MAG TPA: aldo/keto reductase [Acidimicrobiales bacterium]
MRDRLLGRSGIRVSELCLGTMMFDNDMGWRPNADTSASRKIYEAYREAGGYFVDTANIYGNSEEALGSMIAADERDSLVLATKFTLESQPGDPNSSGSHRKNLRRSVESSLRRLGTDYIDLLWVHAWDQRTPLDETLRALDDVVASGKVMAIGVSNTPAWVISSAIARAELQGRTPFCALQVQYSLVARTADREMLPMAAANDLAVTGWAPLAMGVLAGKEIAWASARDNEIAKTVAEVAGELGATPSQVALAWSIHRGVIPVVGSSKPEQLTDSLGAVDLELPADVLTRLGEASAVDLGYPHEFLTLKTDTLGAL